MLLMLMDSEEEAIKELMEMSREQLDLVPFDTLKWICGFKKCNCHTKIRDYGLGDLFYHPKMATLPNFFNPFNVFFVCGKHWKFYNKLVKIYGQRKTINKVIDLEKERLIPIIKNDERKKNTKRPF